MKVSLKLFFFFVFIAAASCKSKTDLDDTATPKTLLIGLFGGEDPNLMKEAYDPIRKHISESLHMPVELVYTSDYTAVIEALRSKKVHMAYLNPFAYVVASKNVPITPIIVLGSEGKPNMYNSSIIVRKGSDINSMEDVKARAKNLTISFVDPVSASGHLVPRAYLTSIGLDPDTAFKQTIFAGGHLASVLSVKSGKVDLGCTSKMVMDIMAHRGMINEDDVKIIWTSEPIVSDPVVVRNDLNKDFVKKVQDIYLNMYRDNPKVLHDYLAILQKEKTNLSYMVAQDSMYDNLRQIMTNTRELKFSK